MVLLALQLEMAPVIMNLVEVLLPEVLGDEIGEAGRGIAGILGGVGIFSCGICSLILGGVLALVLKDEQPPTQMV